MRKHVRFTVSVAAMLVIAATAYAGGWVAITVNEFPDYAEVGKPLQLTFSVRQHGMSLMAGLKPTIKATAAGGLNVTASAKPTSNNGEYAATLNFAKPGEWTIVIDSSFNGNSIKLPTMKVFQPGSPLARPFADITRGGRLFTAKGCVACHRHVEINPESSSSKELDLSTRRFDHEYLHRFLADPTIKTTDMPNLGLKHGEITALATFINKFSGKKKDEVLRLQK